MLVPVVLRPHGHAVEAHTAPEVAAAPQELHLVDAPAKGPGLDRPVSMARGQGPCAEVVPGCDPAQVAEGHVPVHWQVEGAEEPELGTDREPNTSN